MKLPQHAAGPGFLRALETGAVFHVRRRTRRFELTGPGRLQCLQGLVSCDVVNTGGRTHLFGALLTSKGMIVAPLWVTLREESILLETPVAAAGALAQILSRSLPPRLCRAQDVTDSTGSIGVYGPAAEEASGNDRRAVPAVARGARGLDLILAAAETDEMVARLTLAGAAAASDEDMEVCRVLAGIPALGAEIDEKTLPQEVRYEELGAVSYTKGCYLGQETVARVHFRGHANRRLALLVLDAEPAEIPAAVSQEGRSVGRATSACWSWDLDCWVAQAVVRREVEDDAEVSVDSVEAVVRLDRWLRAA